jgi:CDP-glucose 4,6-dehydratase
MQQPQSFWQNKRVLLTGHTGFKGSWLSLLLSQLGAKVTGFALAPPTQPNLFDLAGVQDHITHVVGDIRNYADLFAVIQEAQPEIVIHMAAQPLVLASYDQPIETYATNVMGTVNLFEALRQTKSVKAIVNVTTDKCYENKEWNWGYRENDVLGGHDPYSNSKACAELVTSAFRNSFFKGMNIGSASARAGNVIGGGDWAQNRLIPDIIQACMDDKTVSIRNPEAMRPWQHVLEPLQGYLLLAEKLYQHPEQFAEAWNFGPQDEDTQPVRWIADYVVKQWGQSARWAIQPIHQPHEACYLKLDHSKAKTKLGWQPRWNLKDGLNKTIEWYQAYQQKQNMHDVTIAQITSHLENK